MGSETELLRSYPHPALCGFLYRRKMDRVTERATGGPQLGRSHCVPAQQDVGGSSARARREQGALFGSPGLTLYLPHLLQTVVSPLCQGSCVPKPAAGQGTAWAGSPQHPSLGAVSCSVTSRRGLVVKSWPQAQALHFTFSPSIFKETGRVSRGEGCRSFLPDLCVCLW